MYICNGKLNGRYSPHSHELAHDAKLCYGIIQRPVHHAPAPAPVADASTFAFGTRSYPSGPLSRPQYDYIKSLGGNLALALTKTYAEASAYIEQLKGKKYAVQPRPVDPRLALLSTMLESVPDGYYALQRDDDGDSFHFMRFSRPKSGRYAGTLKFQQQHGNGYGGSRWTETAIRWPNGGWTIELATVVDYIMLLVADPQTATLLYSEMLQRCCRCNAELTDDESRWYRIGPECVKHNPMIVIRVEEMKGPWKYKSSTYKVAGVGAR